MEHFFHKHCQTHCKALLTFQEPVVNLTCFMWPVFQRSRIQIKIVVATCLQDLCFDNVQEKLTVLIISPLTLLSVL